MAVNPALNIVRRITGLTPLLIVLLLFLAPVLIWLIKTDPPRFEQVEVPARVLDVQQPSARGGRETARVTVRLDTGETVVFELPPASTFASGGHVTVIRSTGADGSVVFSLKQP